MSESLSPQDQKAVLNILWKDRAKWRRIGIQLNFLDSSLDAIEGNCKTMDDSFMKLVSTWLCQIDPTPTWTALVEALNSPLVDCRGTALDIESKYIHKEPVLEAAEDIASLLEDIQPDHLLKEQVQELDARFSNLVGKTQQSLKATQNYSVSFLRTLFGRFPSTRRHEHKEFLDKYIFGNNLNLTVDDLWMKFCNYWHFINYELLKFIVDKSCWSDDLNQEMKLYEDDLKRFCEETFMHDFVKCFPVLYQQGLLAHKPNSVSLDVKVTNESKQFRLVQLNRLESDFVTTFSLPKICGLIVKHISPGCFLITWSVPTHYCKLLRWKLSICDQQFFDEHDIENVFLNGELCYCKGSERISLNPADEVASNTTITAEVFDLRAMMERVIVSSPPFTVTQLCTAYICKLLTQHLSTNPKYGEMDIQIHTLSDLPTDIYTEFLQLSKIVYTDFKKNQEKPRRRIARHRSDETVIVGGSLELDCGYISDNLVIERRKLALSSSGYKFDMPLERGLSPTVKGLGLTNIEKSRQVIAHHTIAEYLAAYHIATSAKEDNEALERIVAAKRSSFLPYFVAGLREWDHSTSILRMTSMTSLSKLLFAVEVNLPLNFAFNDFHYCLERIFKLPSRRKRFDLRFTKQNLRTRSSKIESPKLNTTTRLSSDIDLVAMQDQHHHLLLSSFTDDVFTYAYTSFAWGKSVFFSDKSCDMDELKYHLQEMKVPGKNWMMEDVGIMMEYVTRGVISASELVCSTHEGLAYPQTALRVRSKVDCASRDLDHLLSLPYSILNRVSDLTLESYRGEVCHDSSELTAFSEPLMELLGHNTALQRLVLTCSNSNQFTTDLTTLISEKLSKNVSLKELEFCQVFTADHLSSLCSLLKSNVLTSLKLNRCKIGDDAITKFVSGLQDNVSLKILNLSSVTISATGASALSDALTVNNTLSELHLLSCMLQDAGACKLRKMLARNQSLEKLELPSNDIGNVGAQGLAEGLAVNKMLKTLSLFNNKIQDDGAKAFTKAIQANIPLTSLFLARNNIGDDGALALAKGLILNRHLSTLHLSRNRIHDNGAKALAKSLEVNTTLKCLHMSGNKFGDKGAQALADMLIVNKKLEALYIDDNEHMTTISVILFQDSLSFNRAIKTISLPIKLADHNIEYDEAFCFW